jgi:hypothetical protein
MSDDVRALYVIAFLMLLVMGALVFLDWKRAGEIEHLHDRIDAIDTRPVARILRARDDETAEAIAREGA